MYERSVRDPLHAHKEFQHCHHRRWYVFPFHQRSFVVRGQPRLDEYARRAARKAIENQVAGLGSGLPGFPAALIRRHFPKAAGHS